MPSWVSHRKERLIVVTCEQEGELLSFAEMTGRSNVWISKMIWNAYSVKLLLLIVNIM